MVLRDALSCPLQIREPAVPRRARRVTARALSVLVMTRRAVEQRVALDAAGAIELRVEPLAVTVLAAAEHDQPELIVMDASSSFDHFIQLFRSARTLERLDHIPIIAWLDPTDADLIADTMNAGVDDCLTADLMCAESIARLRSATRRAASRTQHSRIRYADVTLDTVCLKVWRKGRIVPLTVFQLRLLQFLMTHPGEVFSRRRLLSEVWGTKSSDEGAVTACVARIRRALGDGHGSDLIRSVRGAGYALDDDRDEARLHPLPSHLGMVFKL